MTQEELTRLKSEAEAEFKKYPGVVGVGYGFKVKAGQLTEQLSFRVYVIEKKDPAELTPSEVIPSSFKGVPIDVMNVPRVQNLHCEDMKTHSPLISGISISPLQETGVNLYDSGTLGFFATINGEPGPKNVVLVSNHHVLAAGGAQVGDTIYQPRFVEQNGIVSPVIDKKQPSTQNPIGTLHKVGLQDNHPYQYPNEQTTLSYFVDCATAKLNICISSWCQTNCGVSYKNEVRDLNINGNSKIDRVARLKASDLQSGKDYVVYKVGRRTTRTKGKVTAVDIPVASGGVNVIEIMVTELNCNKELHFADPGDSGSAIINSQNEVVGILFGRDSNDFRLGLASHIHPVLDMLDVTAITSENPPVPPAGKALTLATTSGEALFNHTPVLREKFLSTEVGRSGAALIEKHRHEVVHLVNHCRPVTVAWHRNKGPAFLNRVVNNARDPQSTIPCEIEGVTRETLLRNMASILSKHGSTALGELAKQHLDEVLSYAERADNLHVLVEQLSREQAT